jgi:hypothetical protein
MFVDHRLDDTNIWVANQGSSGVTKLLASTGAVVGNYAVGGGATGVAFDGTNIWVTLVVNQDSPLRCHFR